MIDIFESISSNIIRVVDCGNGYLFNNLYLNKSVRCSNP